IIGQFERWISGTGTNFNFPIGNSSAIRPLDITFADLSSGSLIAEFINTAPGNSGLPLTDGTADISNAFLDGYWTLTRANSLASTDYDLDLTGTGFSSFPIVDETRLLIRENSSSDWTVEGTHIAATGETVSRDNLVTLSAEYGFGDTTACTPPVSSVISGLTSVCAGDNGVVYNVDLNAGSSYQWTITGGTIASGQGTNTLEVDWGSTGMMGQIQVIESNSCTQGAPELLNVEIHPLPSSVISGETTVAAGASGEVYSVLSRPNYDYNWTITGGTQVPVTTSASITVDWGTGTSGKVSVVPENTVCSQSASAEELDVTILPVITSQSDGEWGNSATWDCG
ncbi:hypothetical protein LCGC14_3127050, partial [marine sediment metagenome]